jgi:CubicO group peptidase (beta-lactamase class C family)
MSSLSASTPTAQLSSRRAFLTGGAGVAVCYGCAYRPGRGGRVSPTLNKTELAIVEAAAAGGRGQIFVWRDGETLLDRGFGEGMSAEALVPWASACKPTTVAAMLRLVEAGEVGLNDRVTRFIPNFGRNGKADVTIMHLMTHTAALGGYAGPLVLPSWDETIERISAAPRTGGRNQPAPPALSENQPSYNPAGLWILGEVLRIVHGRPFADVIRSEVYLPLDMTDTWNGMPQDRYDGYGDRIVRSGFRGGSVGSAEPEQTFPGTPPTNPAGGALGPLRELGNFYRMALDGGAWRGSPILNERTLREATRVQASDGGVWTFGLGFMINVQPARPLSDAQDRLRFGRRPSVGTFGHSGATGTVAFADPKARLVVAMIGLPLSASDAVYDDLALA